MKRLVIYFTVNAEMFNNNNSSPVSSANYKVISKFHFSLNCFTFVTVSKQVTEMTKTARKSQLKVGKVTVDF